MTKDQLEAKLKEQVRAMWENTQTTADLTACLKEQIRLLSPEARDIQVKSGWGWMSFKDKCFWRLLQFFPKYAAQLRTPYIAYNHLYEEALARATDREASLYEKLEIPLWLYEKPKELVVTRCTMPMPPMKYLSIEVKI